MSTMTRIKPYIPATVLGVTSLALLLYTNDIREQTAVAETEVKSIESELAIARQTDNDLSVELDTEAAAEEYTARTVSAEKIAKELIAVDDTLTQFFKMNEVIENESEREKFFASVDIAKQENTRLTGATEADHIDTWKKNPEWTTKLETVVVYADAQMVPIVFSMKTKDGRNAGLVFATYDSLAENIVGVSKLYTRDGIVDESSVGGR